MTATGPQARRGVLAAELVVLVAAVAVDVAWQVGAPGSPGALATAVGAFAAPSGSAVAVLAVLRRRFPRHVLWLGLAVAALSLLDTAVVALGGGALGARPPTAEVCAAALLVGAGCRRLPPVRAAALAAVLGAAVVAAPLVRFGLGSTEALLGVPAAVLWGAATAVGLVLRDADRRHRVALDRVRADERLELARELHDLVAHHVSGIVVRAQAARVVAAHGWPDGHDPAEVYREIEEAGAEALTATRRLVGVLRSREHAPPPRGAGFGEVVRAAADGRSTVDIAEELEAVAVPPVLAGTVHRVVLEALINARRHAPDATEVRVSAFTDGDDLVLEVRNDRVPAQPADPSGSGYGVVGMAERVAALGGSLRAGPEPGGRWRVTARLPLGPEEAPFGHLSAAV